MSRASIEFQDPNGVPAGSIQSAQLADGAVTTAKLADSSVSTAKIINASVTAEKLATGAAAGGTLGTLPTGSEADIASTDTTVQALADHQLQINSVQFNGWRGDPLRGLIQQINAGPTAIQRIDADQYQIWTPVGSGAPVLNAAPEWARWLIKRTASGRRYGIKGLRIERFVAWVPVTSPAGVFSGGGTAGRYSQTGNSPTYQPQLTGGKIVTVTLTGQGDLYLLCMGRPSGTQTLQATIFIEGSNPRYNGGSVVASPAMASTTDFAPVYVKIADNLPQDTYTVQMTSGGGATAFYPIAVGFASGAPGNYNERQVRVGAQAIRIGTVGSSTALTPTTSDATVTHGGTTLNAGQYLWVFGKAGQNFSRIDLGYSSANTGGSTQTLEYWNGSAWTTLTTTQQTSTQPFRAGKVEFVPPSDWADVTENGTTGRAIRLGLVTGTATFTLNQVLIQVDWRPVETVRTLSAVDTEWEPVWNRDENPGGTGAPWDDTGGGHGNEALQSITIFGDGNDITSLLADNASRQYRSLRIDQNVFVYSEEPPVNQVGAYLLRHSVGGGGLHIQFRLTVSATTTMTTWAYRAMAVADPSAMTHVRWMKGAVESDRVAIAAEGFSVSDTGRPSGVRLLSTAHPYSFGLLLDNNMDSGWRGVNAPSAAAFVLTNASNLKAYFQVSGNANPRVLTSGQTWESSFLVYAGRI